MKNLKISKKLFISYAIVLVLLIMGTIVSIFNLVSIGKQVEDFYSGPFTMKSSANTVDANFEAMQKSVYRSMANEDLSITNDAINDAKQASQNIQAQIPVIVANFKGDPQIVADLQKYLAELSPMREHVLELSSQNKNAEAAAYMEANNIPTIEKAQVKLNEIISFADNRGELLISALRSSRAQATIILIAVGLASVIISIVFGVYITRSITKPVSELEQAAKKLSDGDLKAVITYESKDELGSLAQSMRATISGLSAIISDITYLLQEIASGNFDIHTKNEEGYVGEFRPLLLTLRQMNTDLSDTMRQINQSSDQVASGSDQVSSGSQALSQGATEQASSVEELAATINEIAEQVKTNALNAEDASKKAGETGDRMMESNQQMQQMIKAMDNISNSSSEIGKIIKTIEDIAFQTNILALNAAVEAARAGAAGKGFAVVADEVRNLASKSSEASKSTAALIEGSIRAVGEGTRIAGETAQALVSAVEGAKVVVETIDKISCASNEQAASIAQITQGIDQISSVVQTNSATAEESAAASEELSSQAQMLKSLVSRFKLKDSGMGVMESALPQQISSSKEQPAFSLESGLY